MKKSWKKALLAGLSIVMMGSFIAGCGSDNNGAANKDVLKVGVTNFASTLEPTENFFAWSLCVMVWVKHWLDLMNK